MSTKSPTIAAGAATADPGIDNPYMGLELPDPLPPGVDLDSATNLLSALKLADGWARVPIKIELVDRGVFTEAELFGTISEAATEPTRGTIQQAPPPPQARKNLDGETRLVGHFILVPDLREKILELTCSKQFAGDVQRRVMHIAEERHREGLPINPPLMVDRVIRDGPACDVGGPLFLEMALGERLLPQDELLELARSVSGHYFDREEDRLRRELGRIAGDRRLRNGELRHAASDVVRMLDEVTDPNHGWDPPLLDGQVAAEPFPLEVLPASMAEWIRETAKVSFFPPDFVAIPILAIAGAGIGRSVALQLKEEWIEFPSLFSAIVGDPGTAKTPALKMASRPVWTLSRELLNEHELTIADVPRGMPRPKPRRIAVGETTTEGLALRLSENSRGLVMVQDELSGWLCGMNQYKSGNGDDRQFYLKVWSSSPIPIDRKGQADSVPIWLGEPLLGITGGIQPDMLGGLNFGDDREDGFTDRLLFGFPDLVESGWTRAPAPKQGRIEWSQAFRHLWDRPLRKSKGGDDRPHLVAFTPAGERAFDAWCAAHCKETNEEHFPKHLKGPWRKMIIYAGRLSIIVEQLHWAYGKTCSSQGTPKPVGAEAVNAAALLLRYFKNHFRRVFATIRGGNSDDALARALLSWLESSGRRHFTEREARNNFRRRLDGEPQAALDRALRWLLERGVIRKNAPGVQGRGKPGTTQFDVSPLLGPKRPRYSEPHVP